MATPIADMVEKMLSTGIPPEMIVLAVRTAEEAQQVVDPTAEKRRAWDRERKRRQKENNSTGIPERKSAYIKEEPSFFETEVKKEKVGRKNIGTRLPSEWKPDADDCTYAIDHGLDPKTLTPDFRDYWHARAGPGAVKVDWKATWRRWCRTASERKNGNGALRPHSGPSRKPRHSRSQRTTTKTG